MFSIQFSAKSAGLNNARESKVIRDPFTKVPPVQISSLFHTECPLCSSCLRWVILCVVCCGCSSGTFRANNDDVPNRYNIKTENVVLHSDVKLDEDHELIQNLKQVRRQIADTLELKLGEKKVEVYLFKDEETYHKFLANNYPGLPPRRAYFVGTSTSLSIYTVWSERILVDLRHEFTHGVLHASLPKVPLWLDEGLAEYFELPTAPGIPRADYLEDLSGLMKNGWRPNLQRLEHLDEVGEMQRLDYAESWAWVHWMLHNNPQTRSALIEYANNPSQAVGLPLSRRLRQFHPNPESALAEWIAAAK